jgi:exonuclease-1
MAHSGVIDFIIAEDSDLLAYRCPTVFFKMNETGMGQEIKLRNLGATEDLDLLCWTHEMFADMCILSGCDYCPRLNGLGLKNAHKLIKKYRSARKV